MGLLYQKRRLKVNKAKRRIAINRAHLNRFRVFLAILMVVAICYFGIKVLKLSGWYLDSAKLYAADPAVVTIQGNLITPYYKIINLIRQTKLDETQIFRLSTDELEKNISQLQSVKNVYVRRYWNPARLVIVLEERMPVFLLAPNLETEPVMALTADGIILDRDYLAVSNKLKAKKVLTYGVQNGREEIWDKKKVEELMKFTKAVETYSNTEIKYLDMRNPLDIYIALDEYLIRFGELNNTAYSRAKYIGSILPQAKNYNQKIKYIDLRWENSKYFRLEDAAEKVIKKEITPSNTKTNANEAAEQKPAVEIQSPTTQTIVVEDESQD